VLGGIVVDDYDMMMIKTLIKSGQRQHLVQLSMVVVLSAQLDQRLPLESMQVARAGIR
jgi:hypothetical protein